MAEGKKHSADGRVEGFFDHDVVDPTLGYERFGFRADRFGDWDGEDETQD